MTLRAGDVVRLKSGGPKMTIAQEIPAQGSQTEPYYRCEWFANSDTAKWRTYPASSLEIVRPD